MARLRKGIYRPKKQATDTDDDLKVADFSYQNDALAQLIVHAWTDGGFQSSLLQRETDGSSPNAKAALADCGIYLSNPIVITEADYDNGFDMHVDDQVVFVLPNYQRTASPVAGHTLLETAKLLMACVPNGI